MRFLMTRPFASVFAVAAITLVTAAEADERKALMADLNSRNAIVETLLSVERMASRIVEVETTALLSEHGAWPNDPAWNWPADSRTSKRVHDLKNLKDRMASDLANLKRSVLRGRGYSEEEAAVLKELLDDLNAMIEQSGRMFALLSENELDVATTLYKESALTTYQGVMRSSFTLSREMKDDLRQIGLKLRKLEQQ